MLTTVAYSQPKRDKLLKLTEEVFPSALENFKGFLSIPNNGLFPEHVEANMLWCEDEFQQRGFETQRIDTKGAPLLLAERQAKRKNKPTLLIYLQIDGQPVDSSKWNQPSPYTPVLKFSGDELSDTLSWQTLDENYDPDWRIYARSASDAKGPVAMFLAAMDVMNNYRWQPDYNLKIIMDFEEELGSPHLPEAVEDNRALLAADMLVILDGPRHPNNKPTLTFGARGISTITLKVFGPKYPQHSGHYGNYVPNPALRLSQLLSSMKDAYGRTTISGFYEGITLADSVKNVLRRVPDDEDEIMQQIGIASPDSVAVSLQEAIQYPSLNIRGLSSGWVGDEVRTIIPSEAVAEIDIRLVKETDGVRLVNLVKEHIKNQGYHFVEGQPTDKERTEHSKLISFEYQHSYAAFRTSFNSEIGVFLEKALQRAFIVDPIKLRTSGGSIPIAPFVTTLGVPAVTVPTVNRDNNQHSPNENIRLGNFFEGIVTCLAILTEPMK
ncbi:M20/M25/M40 family metallo-hydrolase [Fulvivirga sp. RKSG066]|nr:M20/M25/M40 family metallo-hydrolase [Fulvivirga aurantia]